MITLTLRRYHVLYWGFEYSPKHGPFKNALFEKDHNARKWLAEQGVAIEVDSDTYQLCDCYQCDHCKRRPIKSAASARLAMRREGQPYWQNGSNGNG